jgi:hypothetical protein
VPSRAESLGKTEDNGKITLSRAKFKDKIMSSTNMFATRSKNGRISDL